jgi:hypothetical protein
MCAMRENQKNTEAELRSWVAGRLHLPEVAEEIWGYLQDGGYVKDALDDMADGRSYLLETAQQLVALVEKTGGDPTGGGARVDGERGTHKRLPIFTEEERVRQRAEAVSLYLSKVADQDREVKKFREEILGGRTLSREEAKALLTSPAAAFFSPGWFEENKVPLADHEARILWPEDRRGDDSSRGESRLSIEWTEGRLTTSLGDIARPEPVHMLMDPRHPLEWLGGERPPATARGKERPPALVSRSRRGSVLGELARTVLHLTRRFPWEKEEAELFVLTGETVQVPPIYEELPDPKEGYLPVVKLAVAPWVPAETVKEVFTERRKELKPTPTTSSRRLALFRYVLARTDVTLQEDLRKIRGASLSRLMEGWNEQLPTGHSWRYNDRGNFRQGFYHALDQLVGPIASSLGRG